MMDATHTTGASLAGALGRSRNSIYNMFSYGTDVRAGTLSSMAQHMGYELVLRNGDEELVVSAPEKSTE